MPQISLHRIFAVVYSTTFRFGKPKGQPIAPDLSQLSPISFPCVIIDDSIPQESPW
jgi:hypothetical protein